MARFSRLEVASKMHEVPLVPVFYHQNPEVAKKVLQTCYDGGVRVMEFTNRGDFAHEVFAGLIQYAQDQCPDLILGIGSVVDPGTTALYLQNGANFIVSPILNPEMAKICNRRKVMWAPGCATLSEISFAEELGAEIVKIFPGSVVGGPAFVKAIKGPSPWSSIMPTGGVSPDPENLRGWFEAGVSCVGMGSKLLRKDLINEGKWGEIQQMIVSCLTLMKELRP
ncbi:MAG: bifunctional 4-hydroxy-2-oxoglutarate aldolase/2-dehydro-3-deoxy-phosphogluconate aldolase [Bacteroidota bacterium]